MGGWPGQAVRWSLADETLMTAAHLTHSTHGSGSLSAKGLMPDSPLAAAALASALSAAAAFALLRGIPFGITTFFIDVFLFNRVGPNRALPFFEGATAGG